MNLDTILRILYANDMTDVVVLATKIDGNIENPNDKRAGELVTVRVSRDDLPRLGLQPKNPETREHWFNIQLPILAVNQYALKDKYLVEVLGKAKWVDGDDSAYGVVEPINEEVAVQSIPQENIV